MSHLQQAIDIKRRALHLMTERVSMEDFLELNRLADEAERYIQRLKADSL